MATATTMYHTGLNTLKGIHRDERAEKVDTPKGDRLRRLHKAFLRYHDPNNWPLLRQALKDMGRADLIGNGKQHLIPTYQPLVDGDYQSARRKNSTPGTGTAGRQVLSQQGKAHALAKSGGKLPGRPVRHAAEPTEDVRFRTSQPTQGKLLTQHTGLPPRATGAPVAGRAVAGRTQPAGLRKSGGRPSR
jgi:hypothetical protein